VLFIVQSPYWFTIGHRGVFSLGRWAALLRTEFHELRATLVRLSSGTNRCRVRDYHPLWWAFPDPSASNGFVTPQGARNPGLETRTSKPATRHRRLRLQSLVPGPKPLVPSPVWAISAFARRYSRNRCLFLLLQVLRCFSSLRSLYLPYPFRQE
jgi:hypothetical protein